MGRISGASVGPLGRASKQVNNFAVISDIRCSMFRMDRSGVYAAVLDVEYRFPLYTDGNVPNFSSYRDDLLVRKITI